MTKPRKAVLIVVGLLGFGFSAVFGRSIPFASPSLSSLPRRRGGLPLSQTRQCDHQFGAVQQTSLSLPQRRRRRQRQRQSSSLFDSTARIYRIPSQSDRRRSSKNRSFVRTITITNIIVFALQVVNPAVTRWGLKISDKIIQGKELHRLFTPMFLHAGISHLATNSYSLRSVGPDVERFFGSGRFMATYLISGITGNYFSALKSPNPSLGASGAVFGVVGAYLTFLARNGDLVFGGAGGGEAMSRELKGTIALNVIFGVVSKQVDNWGHLGGFLGGVLMAYCFGPNLQAAHLHVGNDSSSLSLSTSLVLVDKPIFRLPRELESIPETAFKRVKKWATDLPVMERISQNFPMGY